MDQQIQLQCIIVDHNELITGICVSESCKAPTKILCIQCLQTVHADCKNQFHSKYNFLKRLNELKQVQESNEITGFKETSSKLFKSIKNLQSCINDFIVKYDKYHKSNVDNQLDQILKKQYLSANDWLNGYKLLIDKPIDKNRIVGQLHAELHQIQQKIDKIISIQSKQDVSSINNQIMAKQLVKSNVPNSKLKHGAPVRSLNVYPGFPFLIYGQAQSQAFSIIDTQSLDYKQNRVHSPFIFNYTQS